MTEELPPPPKAPVAASDPLPEALSYGPTAREQILEMVRLPYFGRHGLALASGLLLLLWLVSGFYRVQPDEQGIILQFGRWVETSTPGVHYHWPTPVERVLTPKITQVNQIYIGRSGTARGQNQMLTGDENIVEADGAVFWRIRDAGQFLFNIREPEDVLRVAAESALREVIGQNPIQSALSDKRQQIADQTVQVLQRLMDKYQAGIEITQVQLLKIDPPSAVIDAFNDVQRARADQERARNEAEAYRNDIIPRARGEVEHIVQEAEAYREQILNLAQGEAESFVALEGVYKKYQNVLLRRLYLESIDEVFKHASRVIIDTSPNNGTIRTLPIFDSIKNPAPSAPAANEVRK